MRKILIDGNQLCDALTAHDYLKSILELPDYYGMNLDALYDCLTDLENTEITLIAPAEDGAIFQRFLRVFKAADRENDSLKFSVI